MKSWSEYLEDVYTRWLAPSMSCCGTLEPPMRSVEKPMKIEHQQPRLIPSPRAEVDGRPSMRSRGWAQRSKIFASRAPGRRGIAVWRKVTGDQESRRPLNIGAPTDFRHVDIGLPRRTGRFRPLELSIYMPDNQLSPLISHFVDVDKELPTLPPMAYAHSRTESSSTFTIPRKPIGSSSRTSIEWTSQFQPSHRSLSTHALFTALESEAPKSPPVARMRAMTAQPTCERVKSALHETIELEQHLKDTDGLIEERQSVYFRSRPTSRATSTRRGSICVETHGLLPSVKSSFVEGVASPDSPRPGTPCSRLIAVPSVLNPVNEENTPTPSPYLESFIPPSPLPLILKAPPHPPLRKKKSFSHISNWLFPSEHIPKCSLESIASTPKPITSRDGFYQCVQLRQHQPTRSSFSSYTTVTSTESELDDHKPPTTGTPASSPGGCTRGEATIRTMSMDFSERNESVELTRMRTFGDPDSDPEKTWRIECTGGNIRESRVGVAF